MILWADSEGPDQTADAQADLSLCCLHMPKDVFLHDTVHLVLKEQLELGLHCLPFRIAVLS